MINVKNVCKSYGNNVIFDNLNIEFPLNEMSAVVGKSGMGKTTLFNMMLGLTSLDKGEILGLDSKISVVFQENRLINYMNQKENIQLVTKIDNKMLDKYLMEIGLNPNNNEPVKNFSGGMKRRVSLLRGLLFPHNVLFLDEPLKGLDEKTKLKAIDLIMKFEQQKTVIIITHDKQELEKLDVKKIVEL